MATVDPPAVVGVNIFGNQGMDSFDGSMRVLTDGVFGGTADRMPDRRIWWRQPRDLADAQGAKQCHTTGYWVPARFVKMVGGRPYCPPAAPRQGPKI